MTDDLGPVPFVCYLSKRKVPPKDSITHYWRQNIVIGIVTRLRSRRSGVHIPLGQSDFSLFQNVRTASGAQPA